VGTSRGWNLQFAPNDRVIAKIMAGRGDTGLTERSKPWISSPHMHTHADTHTVYIIKGKGKDSCVDKLQKMRLVLNVTFST
jgi:hypothetical protein